MATLNTAVQAMVDNLHAKMTGDNILSAEEQTLVAAAIDKLSNNISWEKALIAVAEEHLNTATSNMTSSLNTATSALTNAETKIVAANETLQTQNTNLEMIPQISTELQNRLDVFSQSNTAAMNSNLAGMQRPLLPIVDIETKGSGGNFQRSNAVFAVYDADGASYLARPSSSYSTGSEQNTLLEYCMVQKDGAFKVVIGSHYVHSSTFYADPRSYIYRYSCTAILPLALKDDANDIAFEPVYSSQDQASGAVADYAGIFTYTAGYNAKTLPKQNINATDKWGVSTETSHSWSTPRVLYDNNKHCMVVVDSSTSLIVEKYRDANVTTNVSIADADALQAYVDAGDFTVVSLIVTRLSWPSCYIRSNASETNTSNGASQDCYGFYGILANHVRMGGSKYSAHYRFTSDKKLEPLTFTFCNKANAYTTSIPWHGKAELAVEDMQGNTLGLYEFESSSDSLNYPGGYMANAIMCMNPYSHVGIINETYTYSGSTAIYGVGRTCKAY